jgi:hypothetical protein
MKGRERRSGRASFFLVTYQEALCCGLRVRFGHSGDRDFPERGPASVQRLATMNTRGAAERAFQTELKATG